MLSTMKNDPESPQYNLGSRVLTAIFSDYHLNIQGSAPKVHYVMIGYDPLDGPGFSIATRGVFADALPDAEHTGTNIFEEKYHGSR